MRRTFMRAFLCALAVSVGCGPAEDRDVDGELAKVSDPIVAESFFKPDCDGSEQQIARS